MRETLESGFNVSGATNRDDTRLYSECRRRSLDRAHEEFGLRGGVGIKHDTDAREARRNLLEEVKPFIADRELVLTEASEVAARPRHIGNKTLRDGIGDLNEHDRHRARGLLNDRKVGRGGGQDHIRRQPDQLRRINARKRGVASAPASIDAKILAFNPSQLTKSLDECRVIRLPHRIGCGAIHKHTDAPHPFSLLRAHGERPSCCRAAEQRDELAPGTHSITSSARAMSIGGSVSPRILAVSALMTSSNLLA